MRNRLFGSIPVVVAILALSPLSQTQTDQQSGAAGSVPNLSGYWSRPGLYSELTDPPEDGEPVVPPMLPWAAETYRAHQRARDPDPSFLDSQGRNRLEMALDPAYAACVPRGFPRLYFSRTQFEIYQAPGRVIQIFQTDRMARIIYTDGRGHPEGLPASFMGHSIGMWDGDTLAVETIGLRGRDEVWLDGNGHPHTEALRVVERLRRVKPDTLELELLFDDPQTYTKPWGGKKIFYLRPDWELLESLVCEERIREQIVPEVRRILEQLSEP